jgi:hypothetical protein
MTKAILFYRLMLRPLLQEPVRLRDGKIAEVTRR